MKTTDTVAICPYTGLRSFTEDESLYFKGRDQQVDQITALLEKNKFLMVTGASGEGKSSLIYAGLIPNARAGFFKAKYSNWLVADFRPERSPVTNMSRAISDKFNLEQGTVETELRRGFSAMIDLYTNSEYYIDDQDPQWLELSDTEKKERKRKSANLLIIVDQFEEFFTNPENFYNETPSQDSQVVVNLLLETSRIALRRNLPVFVVCTMRSDYIGQCSAFRGMPEYIGFSQFFVPRLKRKDLKQVIEEPAVLSGNTITQRLVERLVYDITEGVDQLPILQHALSQVWLAASQGQKQMDLIHYAMVGGMPALELPDEDRVTFSKWLESLPDYQRNLYAQTGLDKVIEIHATLLYENAWDRYNKKHPDAPLTQRDAKRIIALTFSCLTKIDNSRAVRNRMTLGEIAGVVNAPEFTTEVIDDVLSILREEGNSFIRPFITDDPTTHHLKPGTVLDITHESLIRNWTKLNDWAKQEYEFYSTYLDFRKQLDRWKKSNKSSDYLLPIGPLTYFENWFEKCKPNEAWIRRYLEAQESEQKAAASAAQILNDTKEFLKKSARKVMITRAFMRYGPQRIATVVAVFFMLVLSAFYWYDASLKENEVVLRQARTKSTALLASKDVEEETKATYLLIEERLQHGTLIPYLKQLPVRDRIVRATATYREILRYNKHFQDPVKTALLNLITESFPALGVDNDPRFFLTEHNKFMIQLIYDTYYNPVGDNERLQTEHAKQNYTIAIALLKKPALQRAGISTELNVTIQHWLTFGNPSKDEIINILNIVSPFSSEQAKTIFDVYYSKGSFESNGREINDFSGGYHTVASLYAAAGDVPNVIRCFSEMLKNNSRNYFEAPRVFNNHINIIGLLYQFGFQKEALAVVQWLSKNTAENPPATLLRNAVIRSGYIPSLYTINVNKRTQSYDGYFHLNLALAPRTVALAIMADYEKELMATPDASERNFMLAIQAKRKAMFLSKYYFDRGLPVPQQTLDSLFDQAIGFFRKVSTKTMAEPVSFTIIYNTDGVRNPTFTKRQQFVYPDYMEGWFARPYHSDAFFVYLQKKNLLSEIFATADDLSMLHRWVAKAYEQQIMTSEFRNDYPLSLALLQDAIRFVEAHPAGNSFDKNTLYLLVSNMLFQKGDTTAMEYAEKIDHATLTQSVNRYEYLEKIFLLNQLKYLATHLAVSGKTKESIQLIEEYDHRDQRIYAYLYAADKLFKTSSDPNTFIYLDSALSNYAKIDYNITNLDSRFDLVVVMSRIGGRKINQKVKDIMRNVSLNDKPFIGQMVIEGMAWHGDYYDAITAITPSYNENQELQGYMHILWNASVQQRPNQKDTNWSGMDAYFQNSFEYVDFLPIR